MIERAPPPAHRQTRWSCEHGDPVRFEHFKGGSYSFLTEAVDEKTGIRVVVYRGAGGTYTRTADEFYGIVSTPAGMRRRFQPVAVHALPDQECVGHVHGGVP